MTEQDKLIRELTASLGQLLEQVYQMQGLFDDEDGTIQNTIDDAEEAEAHGDAHLSALRAA